MANPRSVRKLCTLFKRTQRHFDERDQLEELFRDAWDKCTPSERMQAFVMLGQEPAPSVLTASAQNVFNGFGA